MNNSKVPESGSNMPISSTVASDSRPSARADESENLLRMLVRRRYWIIGSIVVCVLVAILISMTMMPVYQSIATIELNKTGSQGLGIADEFSQQGEGGDLLTDLQTESEVMKGNSLALAVVDHLNLRSDKEFAYKGTMDPEKGLRIEDAPRTRARLLGLFKGGLKVKAISGTRLIQVIYESHDPNQAARIANALIESYKSQYLRSHYDATSEASDWLGVQLSALKSNVESSEKNLTDFEKDTGILSLGSGNDGGGAIHSVVFQKLDVVSGELTAAEANRIEKEAIYRLVRTGNSEAILGLASDPMALQSKSLVLTQGGGLANLDQLRRQQNQLKVDLADGATTYGANNRHLKEMQIATRAMDEQIQQEIKEIVKRAQADYELAESTESAMRQQFDKQQTEASKLNSKAVQFAVLSEEASSRKKLYDDLYTKLQEANVAAGIKATNISVVDPARPAAAPVRPLLRMYIGMALLVGLVLGLGSAYTVETLDRSVSSPLVVEEITGKPVVAVVPQLPRGAMSSRTRSAEGLGREQEQEESTPDAKARQIWILEHPKSAVAEAIRSLRTAVMLSGTTVPKVILITSCIPAEGKTTVAVNLAVSFVQQGKRVLLMEADMRLPSMMHVLNVRSDVGLSSVLAGASALEESICHEMAVPLLDILPSGPRPPMPSELLSSKAFDVLLERMRASYDVVIIDSPPALLVTDSISMASKVDAVLWVSRAGVVTKQSLARAAQLIERNRIPVIGFVVNGMSKNLDPYGYGYGYDYGYGYGNTYGSKDSYYSEEKENGL